MSVTIKFWCKKHPKYTAKKAPKVDCQACTVIFESQLMGDKQESELNDSSVVKSERIA